MKKIALAMMIRLRRLVGRKAFTFYSTPPQSESQIGWQSVQIPRRDADVISRMPLALTGRGRAKVAIDLNGFPPSTKRRGNR